MNTSQTQQAAVDPDIPSAIQKRGPVALTPIAAESTHGARSVEGLTLPGASGKTTLNAGLAAHNAKRQANTKAKKAKAAAVAAMPANPLQGLTAAQIEEVRSRAYPKAPPMDPNLGDRTQAFVNWLFKQHPKDAAIRYAYREIYPTE